MDTAQWPQDIGLVKPIEEMVKSNSMLERKSSSSSTTRPQKEQALNCPRCNSTNTKFCYYNNYSLTQPRYFCKTCRRYWTEGGSLRNVPVGGGSRKNKRSSTINNSSSLSSSSITTNSASSSKKLLVLPPPPPPHHHHHHHLITTTTTTSSTPPPPQNPKIIEGQDLNLAYPIRHEYHHNNISHEYHELPNLDLQNNNNIDHDPSPTSTTTTTTTTTTSLSALELLRTGITSRGFNSFMPMQPTPTDHHHHHHTNTVYSSGFALQDFKQTLNFGLDGLGYGNTTTTNLQGIHVHHQHHQHQGNVSGSRLSFPFEDLKQVSSTTNDHHHQFEQNRGVQQPTSTTDHHHANGFWNGMLGGGSW